MKKHMHSGLLASVLTVAALLAAPAAAHAEDAAKSSPVKVGVTLTGATDYVWRGASQSNGDPAVFAAVNVSMGGFYAGAGTENVKFLGINQEYDLWAGYVLDLKAAKLDVGVVRYGYVNSPINIDTVEVKGQLSGNIGKVGAHAAIYYTGNYFGSHKNAVYTEVGASVPVMAKLSASAVFGHQQISGGGGYNTWNVGASYALMKGVSLDVRYHDTDISPSGSLTKSRLVASLSVSF
ncbi:hypothetical protein GTZ99_07800 [Novosphingobium sp. FSY-8]|uniref:Outer membrane protein beta-barrel domain-containing protein n=1 Tax=Novosphingobium ovatum TaxID=1908523 RepID=A0ABW9XD37_9SPHN|nr:TorF family putative porin [Novosphingobium ovatum]NBC36456.1 hypothetical protein [Novosphingobium ovatum]